MTCTLFRNNVGLCLTIQGQVWTDGRRAFLRRSVGNYLVITKILQAKVFLAAKIFDVERWRGGMCLLHRLLVRSSSKYNFFRDTFLTNVKSNLRDKKILRYFLFSPHHRDRNIFFKENFTGQDAEEQTLLQSKVLLK